MQALKRLRVLYSCHGLHNAHNCMKGQNLYMVSNCGVTLSKSFTFSSKHTGRHLAVSNLVDGDKVDRTLISSWLWSRNLCTSGKHDHHICWSCGSTSVHLFFCSSCKVIQPPSEKASYFEVMNCEQKFALDTQKLQRRYLELQRTLHPDNFSQKTPREQEYSENQSALVSRAYRTLLKPLSRGLYMLELRGLRLEEGTDAGADPELLLEVMEINEKLAETRSREEVDAIGQSMRERLRDLVEEMNLHLNKGDLQSAKAVLIQMKYFTNIEEKVKEKLTEIL
ncbi:iron-sulfur cluster co-chaperone protein HscB [Chanos chanos]|uniref:Iron-sulfur cluster co-chaperone protein HscB n=1 Tax=Chanos chanos TaxID=29144 RepID=A0A6J2WTY5_CHACN|nr:iron-sulfur cluster co-chaperone protein HscB [Chanos chanos]